MVESTAVLSFLLEIHPFWWKLFLLSPSPMPIFLPAANRVQAETAGIQAWQAGEKKSQRCKGPVETSVCVGEEMSAFNLAHKKNVQCNVTYFHIEPSHVALTRDVGVVRHIVFPPVSISGITFLNFAKIFKPLCYDFHKLFFSVEQK